MDWMVGFGVCFLKKTLHIQEVILIDHSEGMAEDHIFEQS